MCVVRSVTPCLSSSLFGKCLILCNLFILLLSIIILVIECLEGEMQLVPANTYTDNIGRIEVCINGTWGIICQRLFDDADASVICKNLGYSFYGKKKLH